GTPGGGGKGASKAASKEAKKKKGGNKSKVSASDAEDEEEEDRRDYDMHRLAREEKLKGKKLRGKRKRKEGEREKAPGQDFQVDVGDERFAAVLEGDTRFGIDRTDTHFKDTEGMRQILDERVRRKDKRRPDGRDANGSLAEGGGGGGSDKTAAGNGFNRGGGPGDGWGGVG
ncbi:unnamed protein product, partial [Laminaria digitata]